MGIKFRHNICEEGKAMRTIYIANIIGKKRDRLSVFEKNGSQRIGNLCRRIMFLLLELIYEGRVRSIKSTKSWIFRAENRVR